MNHWKILLNEPFSFENIQISVVDTWFEYEPEIQSQIDSIWQAKVKESEEKGLRIWDGNNYRFAGFSRNDWVLTVQMEYVKYRTVASRFFPDTLLETIQQYPDSLRGNGLFVGGFIHSSDNFLIFGERSGKYLNVEGKPEIIGWVLQPDEIIVNNIHDVFDGFLKELSEEAGISRESVQKQSFVGIVATMNYNIGLIFSVKINKTHSEILEDFQKNNDGEMRNLLCIPENEVETQLNEKWMWPTIIELYSSTRK